MKTPFRAKTVEEQVDALAQAPEQFLPSSTSARLIRDLYQVYDHSAYTQQLERSLEHIEQRLQRSESLSGVEINKQQNGQGKRKMLVNQQRSQLRGPDIHPMPRRSFASDLAPLAAVLLVTLLVGSLVLTLRAIPHGGNTTTTGRTPEPTTVSIHIGPAAFLKSSVTISQGMSILLINDANVVHPLANGYWDEHGNPHPLHETGMPTSTIELDTSQQTGHIGPFSKAGSYHLYDTIHPYANLFITVLPPGSPIVSGNSPASTNAVKVYLEAQTFRPGTITIHKGASILLLNDTSIEHVITNGRWKGAQLNLLNEPGMPRVHILFHADLPSQLLGLFNVVGTYYLADTVHVGMNLQIIVE